MDKDKTYVINHPDYGFDNRSFGTLQKAITEAKYAIEDTVTRHTSIYIISECRVLGYEPYDDTWSDNTFPKAIFERLYNEFKEPEDITITEITNDTEGNR